MPAVLAANAFQLIQAFLPCSVIITTARSRPFSQQLATRTQQRFHPHRPSGSDHPSQKSPQFCAKVRSMGPVASSASPARTFSSFPSPSRAGGSIWECLVAATLLPVEGKATEQGAGLTLFVRVAYRSLPLAQIDGLPTTGNGVAPLIAFPNGVWEREALSVGAHLIPEQCLVQCFAATNILHQSFHPR